MELQRIVRAANSKYAIGLLFNISGAFDNVWWPSILASLKPRNCPRNLYSLIGSYLTDRKAKIVGATRSAEKKVTKRCPQGSVLGPLFWNLIFDETIEIVRNDGNQPIAFVDNIVVTRKLSEWCGKQKLELSIKKSEMLLLKGFLDIKRLPSLTIRIG